MTQRDERVIAIGVLRGCHVPEVEGEQPGKDHRSKGQQQCQQEPGTVSLPRTLCCTCAAKRICGLLAWKRRDFADDSLPGLEPNLTPWLNCQSRVHTFGCSARGLTPLAPLSTRGAYENYRRLLAGPAGDAKCPPTWI